MFSLRIHSVDTDHPLFISPPSNSNSNSNSKPNSNPKFSERRGIIHLYRTLISHPSTSHPSSPAIPSTLLFIVAVPNYFSTDDLFRFFGSRIVDVVEFLVIRNDGTEDRYSVLIRTANEASADAFYSAFNGKRFSPPEVEICHILHIVSSEFTGFAEFASTPPPGYIELPTCPICLERLDQDTCGIQSTLCDHSFLCSCISKWTSLSCQVCRLCQHKDEKPNCSVCDTSETLWLCIICGFVGCGRYQEGHMFGHWKDTHHCYSLDLDTQRVWDYEGDNYVHRLNHSKADGKSSMVNSHCVNHDGNCGTCGDGEDSEITWTLFNSKVETIMDEYNHLLATQLENQRQYYESLLVEAKSRRDSVSVEATEKASRLKDLQYKLEQYEENKKAVLNMNLIKGQEEYKKKLEEVEKREISSVKSRNEQILDLEEQDKDFDFTKEATSLIKIDDSLFGGIANIWPTPGQGGEMSKTKDLVVETDPSSKGKDLTSPSSINPQSVGGPHSLEVAAKLVRGNENPFGKNVGQTQNMQYPAMTEVSMVPETEVKGILFNGLKMVTTQLLTSLKSANFTKVEDLAKQAVVIYECVKSFKGNPTRLREKIESYSTAVKAFHYLKQAAIQSSLEGMDKELAPKKEELGRAKESLTTSDKEYLDLSTHMSLLDTEIADLEEKLTKARELKATIANNFKTAEESRDAARNIISTIEAEIANLEANPKLSVEDAATLEEQRLHVFDLQSSINPDAWMDLVL